MSKDTVESTLDSVKRIGGKVLKSNKYFWREICRIIYGIGETRAKQICAYLNIHFDAHVSDISSDLVKKTEKLIDEWSTIGRKNEYGETEYMRTGEVLRIHLNQHRKKQDEIQLYASNRRKLRIEQRKRRSAGKKIKNKKGNK